MFPILTQELTVYFGVTYFLKCVYKPRQITQNPSYMPGIVRKCTFEERKGKEPEALPSLSSLTPVLALPLGCHCRAPYLRDYGMKMAAIPVKATWLGAAVDATKLAEQEVEKAEV